MKHFRDEIVNLTKVLLSSKIWHFYYKHCIKKAYISDGTSFDLQDASTEQSYFYWRQRIKDNIIEKWTKFKSYEKWKKLSYNIIRVWRYDDAYFSDITKLSNVFLQQSIIKQFAKKNLCWTLNQNWAPK